MQKRKGFLQLSSIFFILSFETFHSLFSATNEAYLKEISLITRKIEKWTCQRRLIVISSYLPLLFPHPPFTLNYIQFIFASPSFPFIKDLTVGLVLAHISPERQ